MFIRVCVFWGYSCLSFYPFSLLPYRLILNILYCTFPRSPFPLPSGGILKGKLMFPLGVPSRITGAEFAVPWALRSVSSLLVFQDAFS